MTEFLFVYVTTPDLATAEAIGRCLVEERLAACANLWPGMRSIYPWQGNIEIADEVVLILKTRTDLADAAIARVTALHPYDMPCAIKLPVMGGAAPYLAWLAAETGAPAPDGS